MSEKTVFVRPVSGDPIITTSTTTPAQKTLLRASGTASTSGNNTLVAAAGSGVKIVIVSIVLQNESSTATTMILQDGASGTAICRVLGQNQGDGLTLTFPEDARFKGTANTLLNLNLSGANSCGYSIFYYTE